MTWKGMENDLERYRKWHGKVWKIAWKGMEKGMERYGKWHGKAWKMASKGIENGIKVINPNNIWV